MGMDHDEGTFAGQWILRIYGEAFARLGMPVRFVAYPAKRLTVMLTLGGLDGEAWRALEYAAAYPELVRVEEPVVEGRFALFSVNPDLHLNRLEDLPAANLQVHYRRGLVACENALKPWQPAARLSEVSSTVGGIRSLLEHPADTLLCETEIAVDSALHSGRFEGGAPIRRLLPISRSIFLYPYLHRRHAELAPHLAAVLRKMKAEGLIERYRLDALREAGAAKAVPHHDSGGR